MSKRGLIRKMMVWVMAMVILCVSLSACGNEQAAPVQSKEPVVEKTESPSVESESGDEETDSSDDLSSDEENNESDDEDSDYSNNDCSDTSDCHTLCHTVCSGQRHDERYIQCGTEVVAHGGEAVCQTLLLRHPLSNEVSASQVTSTIDEDGYESQTCKVSSQSC